MTAPSATAIDRPDRLPEIRAVPAISIRFAATTSPSTVPATMTSVAFSVPVQCPRSFDVAVALHPAAKDVGSLAFERAVDHGIRRDIGRGSTRGISDPTSETLHSDSPQVSVLLQPLTLSRQRLGMSIVRGSAAISCLLRHFDR
jgi:hypothetical protein